MGLYIGVSCQVCDAVGGIILACTNRSRLGWAELTCSYCSGNAYKFGSTASGLSGGLSYLDSISYRMTVGTTSGVFEAPLASGLLIQVLY